MEPRPALSRPRKHARGSPWIPKKGGTTLAPPGVLRMPPRLDTRDHRGAEKESSHCGMVRRALQVQQPPATRARPLHRALSGAVAFL